MLRAQLPTTYLERAKRASMDCESTWLFRDETIFLKGVFGLGGFGDMVCAEAIPIRLEGRKFVQKPY